MSNYHLEIKNLSRGKGNSFAGRINYISGRRVRDNYKHKIYSKTRQDVLDFKIYLPENAPAGFNDLQCLCDEVDKAEKRYDARTGREFIGSLPNELPKQELVNIVDEFIKQNFVANGLCAVAAIHKGENEKDPSKNNPHVHIIVSTRSVEAEGFNKKKNRELNNKKYIMVWREQWAKVQNMAYERNQLDIRVSHESLYVQGVEREPVNHLSISDWHRDIRGQKTLAGEKRRAIKQRNEESVRQCTLTCDLNLDIELSR